MNRLEQLNSQKNNWIECGININLKPKCLLRKRKDSARTPRPLRYSIPRIENTSHPHYLGLWLLCAAGFIKQIHSDNHSEQRSQTQKKCNM